MTTRTLPRAPVIHTKDFTSLPTPIEAVESQERGERGAIAEVAHEPSRSAVHRTDAVDEAPTGEAG
jgi:hypothetical protein